ncbi:pyridoxal-phosphate-dependent aminotransferase family protein [Halorubrum lacusprofundi]|jgi:Serine-pyruvate aminotransferase/archaeal aspartate aminotransferase|uniref:Aminotransferase class V n=1 Tax=Halorubrum lacusprofundi (strain ATCC 49239 / DSM 5036 / JCM 8891 / ACAM 34) TaxID=416348 RepID=B9LPT0_HALLT|nr:alanine--glyoxylate aminotransferase family protein [Halorubrum lacusprofundi]ACM57368.1 aminotransferase class V [Halorubrum lacusprofundi ATCC 49239]MCG1006030.1 alanine--glyoxylate aminotransferase family protein [Halorubrum lacusprofundi]
MLMTPGPTAVPASVRDTMSRELINPDVDPAFHGIYNRLTDRLATVYGVDSDGDTGGDSAASTRDIVVPGGEGILGLEAAIASLVEPGTEVLCLSNGLYGDGFADFVADYGGEATLVSADYDDSLPLAELESVLADDDREFDLATMVHCETPTGTLNDLGPALDLLDEADEEILTVVDAVSSLGGVRVPTGRIDVCLGASQKCFSAPPGLTTAAISDRAWAAMEERDPHSLYTNFLPWRDTAEGFPYTHLTTEVVALDAALGLLVEEGLDAVRERHRAAATRCRERGAELGLEPYPAPERSSPTVTAFHVPGRAEELQRRLREERDVLVATGLGELADDILRIGHMGHNARISRVDEAMDALGDVL